MKKSKRPWIEWEKIFSYVSDKGLLSGIQEELLHSKMKGK